MGQKLIVPAGSGSATAFDFTTGMGPSTALWLPSHTQRSTGGIPIYQSTLIDANGESFATICGMPKTGNITKVGYRTGTVATGDTIAVRLETIDAATGKPTGTLFGTNTSGSQVILSTDDNVWFETTLTAAAAAVTRGQLLATRFNMPAVAIGNIGLSSVTGYGTILSYQVQNTGIYPTESWATTTAVNAPVLSFGYDDGSWATPVGCFPWSLINAVTASTSTTPDVRGLRYRLPFNHKVSGVWALVQTSDANFSFRLVTSAYHQVNQTGILGSIDMDGSLVGATGAQGLVIARFATSLPVAANVYTRMIIEPTTATSITMTEIVLPSSAILASLEGGEMHETTAKDPTADGSWTNYNNSTDGFRRILMGILVDSIGG